MARRRNRETLLAEFATRIGHEFRDRTRLDSALTHASARRDGGADYERLEFLGDRVLGLLVAELLFREYPDAPEGELSVRYNALVNADALAAIADEMHLHEVIRTGQDVKGLGGRRLKNLRADVVEALLASIYLDGGLEAARAFVLRFWEGRAREAGAARRDPKTALQEWAHQQGGAVPEYAVEARDGPDHEPVFTVSVAVSGFAPARASGRSKRLAEQLAAETVLRREGVWNEGER